jgi:hypothetical protein
MKQFYFFKFNYKEIKDEKINDHLLALTMLIFNLSATMFCPDTGETIPGIANSNYFEQSTPENMT